MKEKDKQFTLRVTKEDASKLSKLQGRLRPLIRSRSDMLRLVFRLGLKQAEEAVKAYALYLDEEAVEHAGPQAVETYVLALMHASPKRKTR